MKTMIEQKIDVMIHILTYAFEKGSSGLQPKTVQPEKKFKFNWEGGLADIKDKMTSVELQHKAMAWR